MIFNIKEKINGLFKKDNLENLTAAELEKLPHKKLYNLALKLNPQEKASIIQDYEMIKEYDSPSVKITFIHKYLKK